jgi:hypothetical protein
MRKVVLEFPNVIAIISYLLTEEIGGLEVNSTQLQLTGVLSDKQIVTACTAYKAIVHKNGPILDDSYCNELYQRN